VQSIMHSTPGDSAALCKDASVPRQSVYAAWPKDPRRAAAQESAQANGDGDAAAGGGPAAAEGEEAPAAASVAAEPTPAAKPAPLAAAGQQARCNSLRARRMRCKWLRLVCGLGLPARHRAPCQAGTAFGVSSTATQSAAHA